MRTLIALACLSLAAVIVAPASAQVQRGPRSPALSKLESRELPASTVTRRVADQLADVLIPLERRPPGRPKRPLESLWYSTRPRPTEFRGLCQADTVIFRFDPVDDASRPGDVPARVVGIESTTGYQLIRPVAEVMDAMNGDEDVSFVNHPDRATCARLVVGKTTFTQADGAYQYLEAMALLAKARETLAAGGDLPLVCLDEPRTPGSCRRELETFKPEDVARVGTCQNVPADLKGHACLRLDAWAVVVQIYRKPDRQVARVEVQTQIIIADYLID